MTGAMYAAISGLKTHMNKLNVIGNNVANVNTYGFKAGRCTFQEALYTTSRSGSNGTSYVGGRNPSQIGYGTELRSIDLKMSTGNYAPTGITSDCMIDGAGFFLVGGKDVERSIDPNDPETLKSLTLTRVGDFDFRADGYLTDSQGNVVYGFLTIPKGGTDDDGNILMEPTTVLTPIRLPFKDETGKEVYPELSDDGTQMLEGDRMTNKPENLTDVRIKPSNLTIDASTGKITCINDDTKKVVTVGYLALGVPANPAGVSHISGPYYKAMDGAGDLSIVSIGGAVQGYVNRKADGTTNDENLPAGMQIGKGGSTKLVTGGLELSNADLATEITEMITTQRGYQANTRIITVTDSMLEELVNMKR